MVMRLLFEHGTVHSSGPLFFCGDDHLLHRHERSTMNGARAVARQSLQMSCRTIPLMREEVIFGKHVMIHRHETVPRDLGDDGGSGNREGKRVSLNDRLYRDSDSRKSHGINE